MSIWNRLARLVGADASGGSIGSFFRELLSGFNAAREDGGGDPQHDVAFTMGVIALCAKMAAADGVVTKDEIEAFQQVFKVPDGEAANVRRVFDLAKRDVAGYEAYAEQVAAILKDDKHLLQDVLEGLFHIAAADGILHPAEEKYLRAVSQRFGFSEAEFRSVRGFFVHDVEGPYEVLGVRSDISDSDLKARHRRLVLENHPDKLIARGVPPEFIEVANRKLAAINEAYDAIMKQRGL